MTQKVITINNQQFPVVFTMDTLMNFEEIVNKSFFESDFKTFKDRMALVIAAVITADEKTTLTIEMLKGNGDFAAMQQIITAFNVVMELSGEFFKIPAVEPKDEKPAEETEGDDKPKN